MHNCKPERQMKRKHPKPLPGHPYHSKSADELRFIIRDAGLAANAMRDHDAKAEGKYLDQQNDANTILGWRARAGIVVEPHPSNFRLAQAFNASGCFAPFTCRGED